MEELRGEGRGTSDDQTMVGWEMRTWGGRWGTREGFAAFVAALRADAAAETPRPPGWVPSTTWWWVDGPEYLGRIVLRHRLTDSLLERGGHVGYDVRPTARRRGHATAMVRAVLPLAYARGIDPVLVTCDLGNVASRRVIEANGGVLEDQRGPKLRFWIGTAGADGPGPAL